MGNELILEIVRKLFPYEREAYAGEGGRQVAELRTWRDALDWVAVLVLLDLSRTDLCQAFQWPSLAKGLKEEKDWCTLGG